MKQMFLVSTMNIRRISVGVCLVSKKDFANTWALCWRQNTIYWALAMNVINALTNRFARERLWNPRLWNLALTLYGLSQKKTTEQTSSAHWFWLHSTLEYCRLQTKLTRPVIFQWSPYRLVNINRLCFTRRRRTYTSPFQFACSTFRLLSLLKVVLL